jgi:hypothetical protein
MDLGKKGSLLLFVIANALIPIGLVISFSSLAGEPGSTSFSQTWDGEGLYMLGFLYLVLAWYSVTGKPRIVPVVFSVLGIAFIAVGISLGHAFPTIIGNAWAQLLSYAGFGFAIGGMCTFIDLARTPHGKSTESG